MTTIATSVVLVKTLMVPVHSWLVQHYITSGTAIDYGLIINWYHNVPLKLNVFSSQVLNIPKPMFSHHG